MTYSEYPSLEIDHHEIMDDAKAVLSGNWGIVIPTTFLYLVVVCVSGFIPFLPFLVGGPLALGFAIFALKLINNESPDASTLFDGFQYFGNVLAAYILMIIAVMMGLMFFIVPGIIIGLGLSQTMFILADDPTIGPVDALKKSWEMMDGYKMSFFILGLRFIPWVIVCALTLFIGMLWLAPYIQVTYGRFYQTLKHIHYPNDGNDYYERHLVDDDLV